MFDQIRPPRDLRKSVKALQEREWRRRQQTEEDLPANLSISPETKGEIPATGATTDLLIASPLLQLAPAVTSAATQHARKYQPQDVTNHNYCERSSPTNSMSTPQVHPNPTRQSAPTDHKEDSVSGNGRH